MVYVISKTGQPIMPTKNHAKVRLLLKTNKVKVVKRTVLSSDARLWREYKLSQLFEVSDAVLAEAGSFRLCRRWVRSLSSSLQSCKHYWFLFKF